MSEASEGMSGLRAACYPAYVRTQVSQPARLLAQAKTAAFLELTVSISMMTLLFCLVIPGSCFPFSFLIYLRLVGKCKLNKGLWVCEVLSNLHDGHGSKLWSVTIFVELAMWWHSHAFMIGYSMCVYPSITLGCTCLSESKNTTMWNAVMSKSFSWIFKY